MHVLLKMTLIDNPCLAYTVVILRIPSYHQTQMVKQADFCHNGFDGHVLTSFFTLFDKFLAYKQILRT